MRSLSSRLLVSVSLLLLVFFGATIAVLDTAFTEAGEQARRDILDGQSLSEQTGDPQRTTQGNLDAADPVDRRVVPI